MQQPAAVKAQAEADDLNRGFKGYATMGSNMTGQVGRAAAEQWPIGAETHLQISRPSDRANATGQSPLKRIVWRRQRTTLDLG